MKFLIINGPVLNMLGVREPQIYGSETYAALCEKITAHAQKIGVCAEIYQSNHEGDLVDKICAAYKNFDGIIINAAAYTHTSIAIADALRAVSIPAVEVHISDISAREEYRKTSYVAEACFDRVIGIGTDGYLKAMDILAEKLK